MFQHILFDKNDTEFLNHVAQNRKKYLTKYNLFKEIFKQP